MENLNLPEDQATLKAVERRRSAEAARKARIYDTRLRVMGLDVDALNKQVEEKRRQQTMEVLRDKTHGKTGNPWSRVKASSRRFIQNIPKQ